MGKSVSIENFIKKAIEKSFKESYSLSHVKQSSQTLPICVAPYKMCFHYSEVIKEVAVANSQIVDLDNVLPYENSVDHTGLFV